MRLIDVDTIDDVVQDLNKNHNSGITRNEHKRITAVLWEMPTIDAVPVVRCKDCKWFKTNYMWNGQECKICVIEPYEPVRKPDDFCSYGERR